MDSISSFAENLILQDIQEVRDGKALPPSLRESSPEPDTRDIRNTSVPESFMQQVLGEDYKEEPSEEEEPQVLEEESEFFGTALVEEEPEDLYSVMLEIRSLLREMHTYIHESGLAVPASMAGATGTGKIGVSLADTDEDDRTKKRRKRIQDMLDTRGKKGKKKGKR